jgi:hypothetical protein
MDLYGKNRRPASAPLGTRGANPRAKRAGWWFWYPFLFGAFFVLGGIGFFGGATLLPTAGGGLALTGAIWLVIGVLSLAVAWWAWRDIHSDDAPPEAMPPAAAAKLDAELRVTGVQGQAVVKSVTFVSGTSMGGSTLVNLDLDVTTTLGGSVSLPQQSRVPLTMIDRLVVGATVPVIVSSTDPSKMIIEWTGLLAPSAPGPAPATPQPSTAEPGRTP